MEIMRLSGPAVVASSRASGRALRFGLPILPDFFSYAPHLVESLADLALAMPRELESAHDLRRDG